MNGNGNRFLDIKKIDLWKIVLVVFVAGGVWVTINLTSKQVEAMAVDNKEQDKEIEKVRTRVTTIEAYQKVYREDVVTIRDDIKKLLRRRNER